MLIDNAKILKYIRGLNNYGLYPTLILLEQYEKIENYVECQHIYLAVKEKIRTEVYLYNKKNGSIYKEQDFPTHISQFHTKEFRDKFDFFGLKADVTIGKVQEYIDAIKKL